jgi:hypothetical protein
MTGYSIVDDELEVRSRILLKTSNSVESVSRDFDGSLLNLRLGCRIPARRSLETVNLALF